MGKYRTRLQIIADVLSVVAEGAKKVHVMYRANLSYKLLCRYLAEVVDAGLVRFEGSADCYRITPKGRDFLERYREYHVRYSKLKEQLDVMKNEKRALKKMINGEFVDE